MKRSPQRHGLCTIDQVWSRGKPVVKVQRDHGNREDRKVARMKYLVDRWGIDKFRATVEEYYGAEAAGPRARGCDRARRPHGLARAR
ncbi:MAG: hypothetical protein R3B96_17960 [Pirellulaceae bacterium]